MVFKWLVKCLQEDFTDCKDALQSGGYFFMHCLRNNLSHQVFGCSRLLQPAPLMYNLVCPRTLWTTQDNSAKEVSSCTRQFQLENTSCFPLFFFLLSFYFLYSPFFGQFHLKYGPPQVQHFTAILPNSIGPGHFCKVRSLTNVSLAILLVCRT